VTSTVGGQLTNNRQSDWCSDIEGNRNVQQLRRRQRMNDQMAIPQVFALNAGTHCPLMRTYSQEPNGEMFQIFQTTR
jgi:hypothetical protein